MLDVSIRKQLTQFELNIRLQVKNEIVVLTGSSGAGKTTILQSIAGLTDPDSGRIALNGSLFFDSKKKSLPARSRNIGYLFQDYALFPHMTVERNILYGVQKQEIEKTGLIIEQLLTVIEQLLTVLGISHLMNKYPHQISGGEKQRIALARALATQPDLLLLDEPLSALDEDTREECQNELLRLHELWKIPFIIVTHSHLEAEKMGDRILHLKNGLIVSEKNGTIDENDA